MKNLNVIANGLKSISQTEASAILEELKSPDKVMCISAVHINDFGNTQSYEYSWQVPEYLWGEIQVGGFVEVENLGDEATVKVVEIFWLDAEEAAYHSSVLSVDHLRLQTPLIYLQGMKPVFCWYKEEIPPCTITYTSIKEVKKVLLSAAKAGIFSLYSFHLIAGACFEGMQNFLMENAPFLGEKLSWAIAYGPDESWMSADMHQPYKLTEEFIEKIQDAGYLR